VRREDYEGKCKCGEYGPLENDAHGFH
jgi:hypothetical protein